MSPQHASEPTKTSRSCKPAWLHFSFLASAQTLILGTMVENETCTGALHPLEFGVLGLGRWV